MNHQEMHDALGAYADGELDPGRRAEVEAHLAACAECRADVEALRELDRAVASQPVPDPGPQYWSRFADRLEARTRLETAAEGGRFYDRLTAWLFPGERFAWVRAATAVAACTLLVTLGLHGFRSLESGSRTGSEIGLPPGEQARTEPVTPPPAPSSQPIGQGPSAAPPPATAPEEPRAEDFATPGPAAQRKAEASRPMAASKTQPFGRAQEQPPPAVESNGFAARPSPETEPAPPAGVGKAPEKATSPEPAAGQAGQLAAGPEPPAVASKPEAGALAPETSLQASAPRAFARREITVTTPSPTGVRDSIVLPLPLPQALRAPADARLRTEIARPLPAPGLAPVESLLARDARLWPRRDEPQARPQAAALATDLAARAADPRVRPRAIAWLEHLAVTSRDTAERDRWQRMLESIGDR